MYNFSEVTAVLRPSSDGAAQPLTSTAAANASTAAAAAAAAVGVESWFALCFLPAIAVLGFFGNVMVCVAIYTDRRLQNVTNSFLFSLAVADLLVCLLVMPLAIVSEVRLGDWPYGGEVCLFYIYADVFLCSASIMHMSVISLDRYLGISRPLKTRNKSKSVVAFKIGGVWLLTVAISSPIGALAFVDERNILRARACLIYNPLYKVYGSTLAFIIPFAIMVVTYLKTTKLLQRQAALLGQKSADGRFSENEGLRRTVNRPESKRRPPPPKPTSLPRQTTCDLSTSSTTGRKRTSVLSVTPVVGTPCATPVLSSQPSFASLRSDAFDSEENELFTTARTHLDVCDQVNSISADNLRVLDCRAPADARRRKQQRAKALQRFRQRTTTILANLARRAGRHGAFQSAAQELHNEQKATRVLGVVFACFFICWTPFFALNLTLAFCPLCDPPPLLASVFLWLGYVSSTLNPAIYTIFNKRFRQSFVRILKCRCSPRRTHRRTMRTAFTSTMRVPANSAASNGTTCSMRVPRARPPLSRGVAVPDVAAMQRASAAAVVDSRRASRDLVKRGSSLDLVKRGSAVSADLPVRRTPAKRVTIDLVNNVVRKLSSRGQSLQASSQAGNSDAEPSDRKISWDCYLPTSRRRRPPVPLRALDRSDLSLIGGREETLV